MVKTILKKIIPPAILNCYYQIFPALGALFFGFPAKKLTVIGVTGTNGKSTVVQVAANILQEAGLKIASISSVRFQINEKEWQNDLKMTMPGRLKLQRFLRQAVAAGCEYMILEVTSEGIKQFRHKFINFDTAVITNLTKEHIESHGGFENYRRAKAILFQSPNLKTTIVNLDDQSADYFLQFQAEKKLAYSIKKDLSAAEDLNILQAKDIMLHDEGSSFVINNLSFNAHLLGQFNVYNILAAVGIGLSQGVSLEIAKQAIEKVKGVSGRMELVIKEPFKVYVDYAHTPDALENVYKTLSANRMICVLGSCGGGRDRWKRPELGRLAANYCSQIILTDEDPYDENPQKILEEIEKGILEYKSPTTHHQMIFNRKGAIYEALSLARPGDVVIITGKGGEPWMCVAGGKKIPWDDREIIKEEFQKLSSEDD